MAINDKALQGKVALVTGADGVQRVHGGDSFAAGGFEGGGVHGRTSFSA